jgi:hypothetical protein
MPEGTIPPPLDDDGEDISWALTTAASLHDRGDHHEALRWLRKAVGAAVAAANDARAIELGRAAVVLEESLGGAATRPGSARDTMPDRQEVSGTAPLSGIPSTEPASATARALAATSGTLQLEDHAMSLDGLDDPTFIDSGAPATSDPMLVNTQTSAGDGIPSTDKSTAPQTHDSVTLPGVRLEDEITMAVRAVPFSKDEQESEATLLSAARTAPSGVQPKRVALLAGADGAARVIPLAPGVGAPEGAAQALLFPMSRVDALKIMELLKKS